MADIPVKRGHIEVRKQFATIVMIKIIWSGFIYFTHRHHHFIIITFMIIIIIIIVAKEN